MSSNTWQKMFSIFLLAGLLLGLVQPASSLAAPAPQVSQPDGGYTTPNGFYVSPFVAPLDTRGQPLASEGISQAPESQNGPEKLSRPVQSGGEFTPDGALQTAPGAGMVPDPIINFDGIPATGVFPPDTDGQVGPNHYVQIVNAASVGSMVRVFSKTGAQLYNFGLNNLFPAASTCRTNGYGDPVVLYDQLADRWLLTEFTYTSSGPYHECFAVSKGPIPTDNPNDWWLYTFAVHNNKFNDYPKIGVWPDGYYMMAHQFLNGVSWSGTGVWVFDRASMLTGAPATFQYKDLFTVDQNFGGMLPSNLEGSNLPPAGAPNYFMEVDRNWNGGAADLLQIFEFHTDWTTPANTTFTKVKDLTVAEFDNIFACSGCSITQPGTSQGLDQIEDRLMMHLWYRNLGDHESLVVNHTVDVGGSPDHAAIRWYEIRGGAVDTTLADAVLYQQGTYAPDAAHRWMGSIGMDHMGNIALGYSVSSGTVYPSIRYTGRLASDPLDTLQAESSIVAGGGSQTGSDTYGRGRWGDYSAMSVDPVDDCTFWYTQEYMAATSGAGWSTRIAAFKFPNCSLGAMGTLEGVVTDASTNNPIQGAQVQATASLTMTANTVTGAAGYYRVPLLVGAYDVTASAFGYLPGTVNNVLVTDGVTTTQDIALSPAPHYTVSGVVTDAATGWPLYASLNIGGSPGPAIWTIPSTGYYEISLPAGVAYTFNASAWVPGYTAASISVPALAGDLVQNIALSADLVTCNAPGYNYLPGAYLIENFDGVTPPALPAGWAVVDTLGTAGDWATSAGTRYPSGQPAHSAPNLVYFNSYSANSSNNTRLYRTVGIDMTTLTGTDLTFWMYHDTGFSSANDRLQVQVSTDGGATWIGVGAPISRYNGSTGWAQHSLDLSTYASAADLRLGFLGISAYGNDIHIDDVQLGVLPPCAAPADGGLVVGVVYDDNTALALAGATVSSGAESTPTAATPDPAVADGFYTLFSPSGAHDFTASKFGYTPTTHSLTVVNRGTTGHDFSLDTGRLEVTPPAVSATLGLGTSTQPVTLSNTGLVGLNFDLVEVNAPYVAPLATGPFADPQRTTSLKMVYALDGSGVYPTPPPAAPPLAAGDVLATWDTGLAFPWGIGFNTIDNDLWVNNIKAGSPLATDLDHRFLPDGTVTGDTIDTAPWKGDWTGDMTYDPVDNKLWQVNIGADNCIYELDPVAKIHTGNKICPAFGTAERGLAYDPTTDTFYAGSWTDKIIKHFDRSGVILDSKNINVSISGLAYNPSTHHLFVMTNSAASATSQDVYVLDTTSYYTTVGAFNIAGLGDYQQAGLEMSCDGHLWAVNQTTKLVIEAGSGETGVCDWMGIPWLSLAPTSGPIPAGGSQVVNFTFDSAGLLPGVYPAQVRAKTGTPYGTQAIPVTLTVTTGALQGIVTDSVSSNPIAGATVTANPGGFTTTTSGAGFYTLNLAPYGSYTVIASAFGYVDGTANNVAISDAVTTTQDFALDPVPPAVVQGTVTDGSGHGWPLYARIDIAGYPDGPVFTDPATGRYQVALPAGASLDFTVSALVPGYAPAARTVMVPPAGSTEDFALLAGATCTAPGYDWAGSYLVENFDSLTPPALPAGWAVVDVNGTEGNWLTHAGTVHPAGNAAHSDPNLVYFNAFSAHSGHNNRLYTTFSLDMNTVAPATLTFWMYHDSGYTANNDRVQVQVSTGGATWADVGAPVLRFSATPGWVQHTIDLSAYAAAASLRLGFLGISAYGNDIHLDDIQLGNQPACAPVPGGLVVGNVYENLSNTALNGATVASVDANLDTTSTFATPLDPAVDDGLYILFSSVTGTHNFTASYPGYTPDTQAVMVSAGAIVTQDFFLGAPVIAVAPPGLASTQDPDQTAIKNLEIANQGSTDLTWSLFEDFHRANTASTASDQRAGKTTPMPAEKQAGLLKSMPLVDVIQDGGFELGTPNPVWAEASTNYGTPLCDASCAQDPSYGPHSGLWWAWFGGAKTYEHGSLTQAATFPAGSAATLSFWLRAPVCSSAGDYLNVLVDGVEVYRIDGASPLCGGTAYTQQSVDVGAFADGLTHTVVFNSETFTSATTNFFVDDVVLDVTPVTTCDAPSDIPWLSVNNLGGTLAPAGSTTLDVTFDSTGLAAGTYTAHLCINSNDAMTPQVVVPVDLHVAGSYVSVANGNWDAPATWQGSPGTPPGQFDNVTISAGTQVGVNVAHASANNLAIEAAGKLVVPDGTFLTVEGALANQGSLSIGKGVSGPADFHIWNEAGTQVAYYTAEINGSLGSTTVEVRGSQQCTSVAGEAVLRCFEITPAAPAAAAIKFYYLGSEMPAGMDYTLMNAWHWSGALPWAAAGTRIGTGATAPGYYWVDVSNVTSFSPFVLSGAVSGPTAITLRSFSARAAGPWLPLAALALALLLGGSTLWRRRSRVK